MDKKKQDTPPIRIHREDYERLKKISEITGIAIVRLIHFALPMLAEKYGVADGDKL